jgi:alanyl-tRNA synthetase
VEDFYVQESRAYSTDRKGDIPCAGGEEGAMAVLRKYGDHVRAIKFGNSMELCGGIHVNTADVWYFKIVSEQLLQEFVDNLGDAVKTFTSHEKLLNEIKTALKTRKIL